ncbi:uncharacterized protein LOC113576438 [Electrophorus electricus]|uniref:Ig-like domain-containing protein n=1 Tax=Electrophorus electricus TaxID=8005 RepID=A0A4W4E124_ELEEL|nr:uncharacterized protein LOC113576438 [Electrophorus electricus]
MWLQNLMLLSQASALLLCDKTIINAIVGGKFHVICKFSANQYRFSKKYWCLGKSKSTCEILMDTDGFTKATLRRRAQIIDAVYGGLHVLVSALQVEDTGIYWVGIDKIYTDIMVKIQVSVREEGVSIPEVWPEVSPVLTCWGQPVTLHCRSSQGTNVQYGWYREAHSANALLQNGPELPLRCSSLPLDGWLICTARNAVSEERSRPVSLSVLQPGQDGCVYALTSEGFESYDCWRTTQPPLTSSMSSVVVSHPALLTLTNGDGNLALHVNQTLNENPFLRSWSGVPVWYDIIRWFLFTAMIATIGLVHMHTGVKLSEKPKQNKTGACLSEANVHQLLCTYIILK